MPIYSPSTAWEFPWALWDMKSIHSHSCFCLGKVWEECSRCTCGIKVASLSFYSTINSCTGSQRQSSQGLWFPLVLQCKILARMAIYMCGGSSIGTLVVSWTETQILREPTFFLVVCSQAVVQGCKTSIREVNHPEDMAPDSQHCIRWWLQCVFSALSLYHK